MSKYYTAKRVSNIYQPGSKTAFNLSRSKLELFLNCPRCFYLDRRLGIGQPPGYPFNLNRAVDELLKKEFDIHRAKATAHPLMESYGIKDVVPLADEKINQWRDALGGGINCLHEPTNLRISGGVDDVWQNKQGELIIVDYKATAKDGEVSIDAPWQDSYKRQIEIYQWLFRQNGYNVSPTAYFVYCNGITDKEAFDAKLEFDIKIIPYQGDDSWVEDTIIKAHQCLNSDQLPPAGQNCDFCQYRKAIQQELAQRYRRKH